MSSNGYNGWTNYETWVVKLWVDNGALCDTNEIDEQARYCAENFGDEAERHFGDWLRDQVDTHLRQWGSYAPMSDNAYHASGLGADLMASALEEVSWDEIARAYCEQARENEREQVANANA